MSAPGSGAALGPAARRVLVAPLRVLVLRVSPPALAGPGVDLVAARLGGLLAGGGGGLAPAAPAPVDLARVLAGEEVPLERAERLVRFRAGVVAAGSSGRWRPAPVPSTRFTWRVRSSMR